MANEHVDPIYEYVDDKINSLKETLREIQRFLANHVILYEANDTYHMIFRHKPKEANDFFPQLVSYASAARMKVTTSEDPLSVATEFSKKCSDYLEKSRIKYTKI